MGRRLPLPGPGGLFRAAQASLTALMDPTRADAVATLGETTGTWALSKMHSRMLSDQDNPSCAMKTAHTRVIVTLCVRVEASHATWQVGRRILDERPRITEASIDIVRHPL